MVNPHRGEVALTINGDPIRMRLTLGALAELETQLETGSLMELAERFESGRVSASDLLALLEAGMRGAGNDCPVGSLADAEIDGGAIGAMRAGLALLSAAFRPFQAEDE